MIAEPSQCLRCRGTMEPGLVLDNAYASAERQTWVDGTPGHSIWVGVKTKGHRKLSVVTFRCERCGYLESYANDDVSK